MGSREKLAEDHLKKKVHKGKGERNPSLPRHRSMAEQPALPTKPTAAIGSSPGSRQRFAMSTSRL
jgi:hypothetical protein